MEVKATTTICPKRIFVADSRNPSFARILNMQPAISIKLGITHGRLLFISRYQITKLGIKKKIANKAVEANFDPIQLKKTEGEVTSFRYGMRKGGRSA